MAKLEYKGGWYSQLALFSMPECEVSPRTFARNIAAGQSVEDAMKKVSKDKLSEINKKKRGKGRVKGQKSKPVVMRPEPVKYSQEEARKIMSIPVNPNKCHLHSYKVFK